jgi:hypothetical protein
MEKAMENKRFFCIVAATIMVFLGTACLFASSLLDDAISSEFKRLKIAVAGPRAQQIETELPPGLSGPNWGLKKIICEQGGYDLSPYAGKKVLLSSYPISEKDPSKGALNAWVVSSGDKILCVYEAGLNSVPGLFAVENPNAKEQSK